MAAFSLSFTVRFKKPPPITPITPSCPPSQSFLSRSIAAGWWRWGRGGGDLKSRPLYPGTPLGVEEEEEGRQTDGGEGLVGGGGGVPAVVAVVGRSCFSIRGGAGGEWEGLQALVGRSLVLQVVFDVLLVRVL